MADFEPLFELKNQYRESCPVLLQSGALYREEPTASAEAEETETAEATLRAHFCVSHSAISTPVP